MPAQKTLIGTGFFLLGILVGGVGVCVWLDPGEHPSDEDLMAPVVSWKWEATVFLPTVDHSGKKVEEAVWDEALTTLIQPFGGATLTDQHQGYWVSSKLGLQRESVQMVVISFELNQQEKFEEVVKKVGKQLGQEAVYFQVRKQRIGLIETQSK